MAIIGAGTIIYQGMGANVKYLPTYGYTPAAAGVGAFVRFRATSADAQFEDTTVGARFLDTSTKDKFERVS